MGTQYIDKQVGQPARGYSGLTVFAKSDPLCNSYVIAGRLAPEPRERSLTHG